MLAPQTAMLIPTSLVLVLFCLAPAAALQSAGVSVGEPAADVADDASQYPMLTVPDAWQALDRGDAERAESIFRGALDRSPRNPALHFGVGYAAYAMGRLDAAIESLKKALDLDPRFVHAAALLAQVAHERGDLELAIRSMERAVSLAPDDRLRAEQLARWRCTPATMNTPWR